MRFIQVKSCLETFQHDLGFLNLLYPHFKQFFQLSPLYSMGEFRDDINTNSLNYINRPVWIVNSSLKLIYQNSSSLNWMKECGDLLLMDGYLKFRRKDAHKQLANKISEVSLGASNKIEFMNDTRLVDSENVDLGPPGIMAGFCLSAIKNKAELGARFVIITRRKCLPQESVLMKYYGLTKRQSQLCLLLMEGHSLSSAATELCIAFNTVRNLLAACFRALKVSSQSDLIRLLYSYSLLRDLRVGQ